MPGLGFDIAGGIGGALSDFELAKAQRGEAALQGQEYVEDRDYTREERALHLKAQRQELEQQALNNPEALAARDEAELRQEMAFVDTLPLDPQKKAQVKAVLRFVPREHRGTILQSVISPKPGSGQGMKTIVNNKTGEIKQVDLSAGKVVWDIPGKPAPSGPAKPTTTPGKLYAAREEARKAGNTELVKIYDDALKKATTTPGQMTDSEIDSIVNAVYSGKFPVTALTKGLFRQGGKVEARMAALHPDYNLSDETLYWDGLVSYVKAQNSAPLIGMRAALDSTGAILGRVEKLYDDFYSDLKTLNLKSDTPLINKGYIEIAKQFGDSKLMADATVLEATLNEFALTLSGAYAPGSPTDARLGTAGKMLSAYLTPDTFKKQVGVIKDTVAMRKSAFRDAGVVSINSGVKGVDPKTGKVIIDKTKQSASVDPGRATKDTDLDALWAGAPAAAGGAPLPEMAEPPAADDGGGWSAILDSSQQ